MKLIFCLECHDIFKLHRQWKTCWCKKSHGRVTDGLNAEIGGKGIPLGIENQSLVNALDGRKFGGKGTEFRAFVIPHMCNTVKEGVNGGG